MKINPLTLIDYYKVDHRRQYPDGTVLVFSNFTPRKSRIPGVDYIIWFGLQYFIKHYLIEIWRENFFKQPLERVLNMYKRRMDTSLGPNDIGVDHIAQLHDLQYLPLRILALPEGSKVPIKVPPMVMWNTHPDFFWLVNYMESILSCSLWQGCTSATYAHEYRMRFDKAAKETGGPLEFVPFQGHDFSFRGMSSLETACISGAGHLLSFQGTDSVPAIDFLEQYYNANADIELIGGSVPATEHSVMCMGGKEGEIETFERLLNLYPKGILSVVSDTWDLWKVLTVFLPKLKDKILAREGKLVIRPDSGNPADILCGKAVPGTSGNNYSSTNIGKGVVEILWDIFGGTVNKQGYKELDSHIGCIYGDSITLDVADNINARLKAKGFASTNWVAGIGSYTYQYNTRDTQGWAMKATYGEIKHTHTPITAPAEDWIESREIWKDPITDDGMKKSAKGLIAVYKTPTGYQMKDQATWKEVNNCSLIPVFHNGELLVDESLMEIRELLKNQ